MNDETLQLLWDALERTEGEIPWPAMGAFADALVDEPAIMDRLFNAYDEARDAVQEKACYTHLYVPAIFALAAPRLPESRRQEIGEFLIARLVEAGEQEDYLMTEVLAAACGTMGPVILPLVFGVVIDEASSSNAWDHLWGLTKLAIGSDSSLRDTVVAACVSLLERIGSDEIECERGVEAAKTLALLGQAEHIDLLRRLSSNRDGPWRTPTIVARDGPLKNIETIPCHKSSGSCPCGTGFRLGGRGPAIG
ncbi:MAG TPA: hypothetical protein PK373_00745 [Sedimentisphaerales bacterium]|nr:hypothetical protein [Sedimentisphaerales bacterium]